MWRSHDDTLVCLHYKKLVGELGITGGDDRKIGYYAGLIVSVKCVYGNHAKIQLCTGISLFCHAGDDNMAMESII